QIGGKGGLKPRLADKIAMNVSEEKLFPLVEKIIQIYSENATARERLGDYIDRVGLEEVKKQIDIESYL
ncbi:sulfite reductase, partial [Clostridium botulinum]